MIKINGVEREFTSSVTITEVLQSDNFIPSNVAVELNGKVVKRCDFDTCHIADGDIIEIVKFVGGG